MKYLNLIVFLFIFFGVSHFAYPVYAQDSTQTYTPPPLFETPDNGTTLKPQNGVLVPANRSRAPANTDPIQPSYPNAPERPALRERGSPTKVAPVESFKPYIPDTIHRPLAPEPITNTPAQQNIKHPTTPTVPTRAITAPRHAPIPTHKPAQKKIYPGVVSGPKTMPARPVKDVEVEKNMHPEQTSPPDNQAPMIARYQAQQKQPDKAAPPAENITNKKVIFSTETKTITFQKGQSEISGAQNKKALDETAGALNAFDFTRLKIISYASANANEPHADRRIALARALAIRQELIARGAVSHRIDIHAMGMKDAKAPFERADLIFENK